MAGDNLVANNLIAHLFSFLLLLERLLAVHGKVSVPLVVGHLAFQGYCNTEGPTTIASLSAVHVGNKEVHSSHAQQLDLSNQGIDVTIKFFLFSNSLYLVSKLKTQLIAYTI